MVRTLRGEPKFRLGSLFFTPGAEACLSSFDVLRALCKHASGDWGDLEASDTLTNEGVRIPQSSAAGRKECVADIEIEGSASCLPASVS